jgi:hypothetical protein
MLEMTGASLLALSCTTSLHIALVAETIAAVRRNPATSHIEIMAGGRAFESVLALPERLEANGYARDAVSACLLARSLQQFRDKKPS